MPTVRDRGVVWCEVCQQSEMEVWCGVRCVNSQTEVWCGVSCVGASMALIQADKHWSTPPPRPQLPWLMTDSLQCIGQDRPHQLTVDLARRAHQSPGRLADEDGLRGLPLAQRTGQGQSGVVAFLVWELVRLQEPLHRRRREDGLRLARQVRHWSFRHSLQTRL